MTGQFVSCSVFTAFSRFASWKNRIKILKLEAKGDDRTDQQKIGAFLRKLRRENGLTQEQLAQKLNVTARTVSRWETGVNLPDLSLLVELADSYGVDIREIIDGERKSEKMDTGTKETLLKVLDYAAADKKRTVKKTKRRIRVLAAALTVFAVLAALTLNFLFGNPLSKAMAERNAETVLDFRFGRGVYKVSRAAYWIEDAEYFVTCEKAGSPDSTFTMNFGMFGNYRYDNHDTRVDGKQNVFDRMRREYNAVVTAAMEKLYKEDAPNVCFAYVLTGDGEETGSAGNTLSRLQADEVELDQTFDYTEIGEKYGEVTVMLDDADLSAERMASLLLMIKETLNSQGVRFQAINLFLQDRSSVGRRGEGNGYDAAGVCDFPCGLIYEEGLADRVGQAMLSDRS